MFLLAVFIFNAPAKSEENQNHLNGMTLLELLVFLLCMDMEINGTIRVVRSRKMRSLPGPVYGSEK